MKYWEIIADNLSKPGWSFWGTPVIQSPAICYSCPSGDCGVALGLRVDVSSAALRRRFLLSLGLVMLSEEDSSVIDGLAAGVACARVERLLLNKAVPTAVGEATSPGVAVAPAVPVTSVPAVVPLEAATPVPRLRLTP